MVTCSWQVGRPAWDGVSASDSRRAFLETDMDEIKRTLVQLEAEQDQDIATAIQSIDELGVEAEDYLRVVWDTIQVKYKNTKIEIMSRFAQVGFRHVILTRAKRNSEGGDEC